MVLSGMIPRPKRFAVVEADPGMESFVSYQFSDWAAAECEKVGVPFIRAKGPNLYRDLVQLSSTKKTRLDTPPFWTANEDGKEGKLLQKCTAHYKIAPIRRAVRKELFRLFGIRPNSNAGLSRGCVEQWIGFTADEQSRSDGLEAAKGPAYCQCSYPLILRGLTKSDIVAIYLANGWPIPVRSMCNACPFHGLRSLKEMHDERPSDWLQAVEVDESVRDLTQIGVDRPCFVSRTLKSLLELAAMDFELPDAIENDLAQCPTGRCFI